MRRAALGCAGGAGRIGGIIAPIAGGFALAPHFSLQTTLALAALLPLAVVLILLPLGMVGRRLEHYSASQPSAA